MTKNVFIKIKGLQFAAGSETIETNHKGTYGLVNGSHYISYEEKLQDSNITINNLIKASPSQVIINKKNGIKSRLVFDMNEITSNYYHTQYGSISLSIRTKSIVIKDKPDLFELKMEYSLLSGDSLISDNQIYITLLPAQ